MHVCGGTLQVVRGSAFLFNVLIGEMNLGEILSFRGFLLGWRRFGDFFGVVAPMRPNEVSPKVRTRVMAAAARIMIC
jgi:hypothetical protein